jgi:cytochrome P450
MLSADPDEEYPRICAPQYDVDLFSDRVLADPIPHHQAMRRLGSVLWLPHQKIWALPRYREVREALDNPELFSSARGFALNEHFNAGIVGGSCQRSTRPCRLAVGRIRTNAASKARAD